MPVGADILALAVLAALFYGCLESRSSSRGAEAWGVAQSYERWLG